jgi:hypothetical protein
MKARDRSLNEEEDETEYEAETVGGGEWSLDEEENEAEYEVESVGRRCKQESALNEEEDET